MNNAKSDIEQTSILESNRVLTKSLRDTQGVSEEHYKLILAHVRQLKESKEGSITVELKIGISVDGVQIGDPFIISAQVKDGVIHSDDGPAIVMNDVVTDHFKGLKNADTHIYMQNGLPSRKDGPAVTTAKGDHVWMENGLLHRMDGPAAIIEGKPIFAVHGTVMSVDEFGLDMGIGVPGEDWMVETNTGMMIINMKSSSPSVVMMMDAPIKQIDDPDISGLNDIHSKPLLGNDI